VSSCEANVEPGSAQSFALHPRAAFVKQLAQLVVGHPREKVAPCGGGRLRDLCSTSVL
jgi:hypothetical protein